MQRYPETVQASTGPPLIGDGEQWHPSNPKRSPCGFNGSAADRRRRGRRRAGGHAAHQASTGPPLIGDGEGKTVEQLDEAEKLQRVRR